MGNGFISRLCEPVRVDFDSLADLITPALPLFPQQLAATPQAGGKFSVTWIYDPYGQGGFPADFQVFEGATAATVDYNTPLVDSVTGLSAVPFDGGAGFRFTTQAYADGSDHVFAARARNSNGVAELNTYTSRTARAIATAPADAALSAAMMGRR